MAYGGYFRLLPLADRSLVNWLVSIERWNQPSTWKFAWPHSVLDYVCFGETAWGDQYAYKLGDLDSGDSAPVYQLEGITMQPEVLASSFEEFMSNDFLRNARTPYDAMLVRARQKLGGLRCSEHLIYVPSLLLTGEEDIDHVSTMEAVSAMIVNGDMAVQLGNELETRDVAGIDTYTDQDGRTRLKVVWTQ